MKCPYCDNEMESGTVKTYGSVPFSYNTVWYPEQERQKPMKTNMVSLKNIAGGHRCGTCKKVIAIFGEK